MVKKKPEDRLDCPLYTMVRRPFRTELNKFCASIEMDRSDFVRDAIEEKMERIKIEVGIE